MVSRRSFFGQTFPGQTPGGATPNLGVPDGVITLQNGELLTTVDGFNSARTITLARASGDDTLVAANVTTATYTGVISAPRV